MPIRTRIALHASLTAVSLSFVHGAPALAAPDEVLDQDAYGSTEIRLQREDGRHELVLKRSADRAPEVLDVRVPELERHQSEYSRLALHRDGRGRLAVVLHGRGGLYWTRVDGAPRLRHVPGTTGRDVHPALFRGRVASARLTGSEGRWTARLGKLRSARATTVFTNDAESYYPVQTRLGARGAVVILSHTDGAMLGGDRVHLARVNRPAKRLMRFGFGDVYELGGHWLDVSRGGRLLTITRNLDERTTLLRFALPEGRRLRRPGPAS